MVCNFHLFKNTKAELFVQKARIRKIIIGKLRKTRRPVCFMAFRNSKVLGFVANKSCCFC